MHSYDRTFEIFDRKKICLWQCRFQKFKLIFQIFHKIGKTGIICKIILDTCNIREMRWFSCQFCGNFEILIQNMSITPTNHVKNGKFMWNINWRAQWKKYERIMSKKNVDITGLNSLNFIYVNRTNRVFPLF